MDEFDARKFLDLWSTVLNVAIAHENLSGREGYLEGGILRTGAGDKLYDTIKEFANFIRSHGLELSTDRAELILANMSAGTSMATLSKNIGNLHGRIIDEMNRRTLLILRSKDRELYQQHEPLFGEEVAEKFSNANYDIEQAGKCLALDRATAAVFHLMRAYELAIRSFGYELGIPYAPSWEAYIKQLNELIDGKNFGKLTEAQRQKLPFYRGVLGDIKATKAAVRNPTMHPARKYSRTEAEEVFYAVRGFMRHVAKHLNQLPSCEE